MVDEPLPQMLTVGRIKEMLRGVPDETVVALVVPPDFPVDPRLTLLINVRVTYEGGPVLKLHHVDGPGDGGLVPMRQGTATVTKDGPRPLAVTVRVAVERPDRPEASYLRCPADAPEGLRAGALSGARFARQAVDRHRFGIEVVEIAGDLDDPAAEEGAAVAAAYAAWRAWGHRWSEDEARPMAGWSLREADA